VKLLYFAWIRSKVGIAEEDITLPDNVGDMSALLNWLRDRSDGFAEALADGEAVRFAVNQEIAELDQPITDQDEIAIFPPMTGGR
jgi:sulfur-carrier protein